MKKERFYNSARCVVDLSYYSMNVFLNQRYFEARQGETRIKLMEHNAHTTIYPHLVNSLERKLETYPLTCGRNKNDR